MIDYPALYEKFLTEFKVTRAHKAGHHLVLPIPSLRQFAALVQQEGGHQKLATYISARETQLRNMEADPLHYGHKPDYWKKVWGDIKGGIREALIEGGNRSAKTEFAADYAVRDLVENDGRTWGFGHTSEPTSIRLQQSRIHKYLPPEWRNLGKPGTSVYVQYREATGFTNSTFILPNKSRAYFFNYAQMLQNPGILEGYEFDGFWADELIPLSFEESVRYRLVTRRGVLIETFTPATGYTTTVAGWHGGAKVIESKPSPLLPGKNVKGVPAGHMPSVMQCLNEKARVYFFFTQWNPYNPYDEMIGKLQGATPSEIKIRAYGWAEKTVGTAFPRFSTEVNVIKRNPDHPWNGFGVTPPRPWEEAA